MSESSSTTVQEVVPIQSMSERESMYGEVYNKYRKVRGGDICQNKNESGERSINPRSPRTEKGAAVQSIKVLRL